MSEDAGLSIKERLGGEAVELFRVHDRNVAEGLSETHEETYVDSQTARQQRACFRQTSTWQAAVLQNQSGVIGRWV